MRLQLPLLIYLKNQLIKKHTLRHKKNEEFINYAISMYEKSLGKSSVLYVNDDKPKYIKFFT